jgi:hypothetical protein
VSLALRLEVRKINQKRELGDGFGGNLGRLIA